MVTIKRERPEEILAEIDKETFNLILEASDKYYEQLSGNFKKKIIDYVCDLTNTKRLTIQDLRILSEQFHIAFITFFLSPERYKEILAFTKKHEKVLCKHCHEDSFEVYKQLDKQNFLLICSRCHEEEES